VLRAVVDMLDDGQPREVEAVIREAGKKIPPGVAIRRNERTRQSLSRRRNGTVKERAKPLSEERQIEAGRRAMVREALRPRFFAIEDRDGKKYVRLVNMPPRVLRDRAAEAAGESVDPAVVIERAKAGDDVTMLLHDLTRPALMRVTLALAAYIADSQR
jgi:hypothetical protein